MRLNWLAFGVVAVCIAAPAALASPAPGWSGSERNLAGFYNAGALWEGAVELAPCARGPLRTVRFAQATPAFRMASQHRYGRLIGEIKASGAAGPQALAKARDCASAAGAGSALPVMAAQRGREFAKFRTAFSRCMTGDAATYVGSLTLWIDERCDW
jgi:hypothetical protein